MDFFSGLSVSEGCKQSRNRLRLARQNQPWRKFIERLKNEAAQMSARVGQDQILGGARLESEADQIEIQRARFVERCFGLTTEVLFQRLQPGQQRFG